VPEAGRDILPHVPIPTGKSGGETPLLVDQLDRGSVELGLGHQGERPVAPPEHAAHPLVKGLHLGGVHGVVQGQHGRAVRSGLEALDGGSTHALRRRIHSTQLRILLLQLLQLAKESIELGVGDLRPVFQVVEPVVPVQLFDETIDSTANS